MEHAMHLVGLFLSLACGPKVPGATTPATSADLGAVADQVVAKLPSWPGFSDFAEQPHIVVLPTDNLTKFKFDTHVATAKLVNGLIGGSGGRFDVIDADTWRAQRTPPKRSTAAAEAPAEEPPPLESSPALLLLHSEVRSTETSSDVGPAVQILVTYRLVEDASARALWAYTLEWTKARGDVTFDVVRSDPSPVAPPLPVAAPPRPAVESPASALLETAADATAEATAE